MGCHTWFKTKSKYSIEDLRAIWIKQHTEWIQRWREITNNPNHESRCNESAIFGKFDQNYFELSLKVYERQLQMVTNGNIKQAFVFHINETDEGDLYDIHDGIVFVETDDMPHDIFRIGGYPTDVLRSMNDTLEFCKRKNIKLREDQEVDLKEFWKENPVGFIDFG